MRNRKQTIDGWLSTHAAHQPDKIALRFEGQSWSYRALDEWVSRLASALHNDLDLTRGDRIAFYGHNSATEVALFFAAAKIGLIMVPLNWRLVPEELRYIVGNADVKVLFYGPEFAEDALSIIDPEQTRSINADSELPALADGPAKPVTTAALADPYLIVYTSGTTGRPKGAVLTQEAVFWNALTSLHAHDFTAQDHTLNMLPLFHVGGINIQMMPCFFAGGTVTLHAAFDPDATIKALENEGITVAVAVPTIMRALIGNPAWADAKFSTLRMISTGSTDVPVDILKAVNARGIPAVQIYGATETGPVSTYQRAAEAAQTIGSIGRPGAHTQIRVVRPDGSDCETDEPGEIWVKGANNFAYYWQDPKATAEAVEDGWFKTGDVARRDSDGLLWFVSRLKHVIISGGENVYPAELERILSTVPGVKDVAVVGRADDRWGEVPVVVAVTEDDGPSRETLLTACDGKIARFKRPKDVVVVDALPKNALGKIVVDDVRKLVTGETQS
ncbi:MAG: AMP-binding protein [Pseudomonadota bacterium]